MVLLVDVFLVALLFVVECALYMANIVVGISFGVSLAIEESVKWFRT